eukprot:UN3235
MRRLPPPQDEARRSVVGWHDANAEVLKFSGYVWAQPLPSSALPALKALRLFHAHASLPLGRVHPGGGGGGPALCGWLDPCACRPAPVRSIIVMALVASHCAADLKSCGQYRQFCRCSYDRCANGAFALLMDACVGYGSSSKL